MTQRCATRPPPELIAVALFALVACSEPATELTKETEPPERIFLFVVDTLRQDHVSAYGSAARTPRMDALAARGQRIDFAMSAYHQTTMSMGALFTGRTPALESGEPERGLPWTGRSWCGMARFSSAEDKSCLPSALTTLAERLGEVGYWTAGITSNQLLFDPAGYSQGFDRWEEVGVIIPSLGASALQDSARHVQPRVMEALASRPNDRFFLYVHWVDVHGYIHDYRKAVEEFDTAFGEMLDELEAQGLLENSWIILTSDHGESLGEMTPLGRRRLHKGNPSFEPELKVPLIVVPPIFPADERFVRTQDVPALLLDALGAEPLAEDPGFEADEHFISETEYQTYRRGRFKSMRSRSSGEFLLFDLEADPTEKVDIAPQHPDIIAAHRARMDALTRELKSDVELPRKLTMEDVIRLRALGYLD